MDRFAFRLCHWFFSLDIHPHPYSSSCILLLEHVICCNPVCCYPGGWRAVMGKEKALEGQGCSSVHGSPASQQGFCEIYIAQGSTLPLGTSAGICQLPNTLLAAIAEGQSQLIPATHLPLFPTLLTWECPQHSAPQGPRMMSISQGLGAPWGWSRQDNPWASAATCPTHGGWKLILPFSVLSKIVGALWIQIKSFICFALRKFCWRPRRSVLLNYFSSLSTLEDI